MIERRFKCEICEWESKSYRMGLLVSDIYNENAVAKSILIHFQTEHPEVELEKHLTSIDSITGSYRSSIAKARKDE